MTEITENHTVIALTCSHKHRCTKLRVLAAGLLFISMAHVNAEIVSGFGTNISFTVSKRAIAATWSDSLRLKKDGLHYAAKRADYTWIQTERIPVGMAWRPPSEAEITVALIGKFAEEVVKDDRPFEAYIRYGCDGVHWSTWIPMTLGCEGLKGWLVPLTRDEVITTNMISFSTVLRIPYIQGQEYGKEREQWENTAPFWIDDTDAFCRWIIKRNPDFFSKNLPFLGYVQVRFENLPGELIKILQSVEVHGSWGMGGCYIPPKDESSPDTSTRWHLFLDDALKTKPK